MLSKKKKKIHTFGNQKLSYNKKQNVFKKYFFFYIFYIIFTYFFKTILKNN